MDACDVLTSFLVSLCKQVRIVFGIISKHKVFRVF